MATDYLEAEQAAAILQGFGYPAPSTDEFTAELRDQVQAFQADAGLHASGIVNKHTTAKLQSRPEIAYPDERIEVRLFQNALNGRGYRLRVTGVFGQAERDALQEYQGQVGITRSGVVDAETWEALGWPREQDPSAP